ncbi:MAG: 50S ribosome-binding GTPase, partial [Desulfovibrio sp.]|nr:50S ribosome-binding GTPase [Desulfovibrio sp.]
NTTYLAAKGGRGGKGNEFFKTATMRAPHFAQTGEEGECKSLRLELKILADVGLLGLPNAGKSTLLSKISAAKPKIAPYPFTTLEPNLGVVVNEQNPDQRVVIADIPGLVEGAHLGQGLGHRFLKHIERTRFLLHIVSCEDLNTNDPWAAFALLNAELEQFDPELAKRKQIEVINKIDLLAANTLASLQNRAKQEGRNMFFISAKENLGLEELVQAIWENLPQFLPNKPINGHKSIPPSETLQNDFSEIEVIYAE